MRRTGFTLIEIAFAIAITASAVLIVMAVFPMGIKAQNVVRYRAIACAKVLEALENFRDGAGGGTITDASDLDKEGVFPWDSVVTYRGMAPDLESAVTSLRGGLKPLPREIALRLDSDNDEIRRLIEQGGYVYYCSASALTGVLDGARKPADRNWLNETRKILIGVIGDPQQNSILYHPSVKVGAYQAFYPGPPTYTHEWQQAAPHLQLQLAGGDPSQIHSLFLGLDALCRDADSGFVFASTATYTASDGATRMFGYKPYLDLVVANRWFTDVNGQPFWTPTDFDRSNPTATTAATEAAKAYLLAAWWYCSRVGLDLTTLQSLNNITTVEAFARANCAVTDWRKVLAVSYLAHAADCLSSWVPGSVLVGGVDCTAVNGGSLTEAGLTITGPNLRAEQVQAWHELSIRMAIYHADNGPYNWGAPRPLNRQVMMDHPLCQLDLWTQPITATLPGTGSQPPVTHRQWRACYPQPIRFPGLPYSYPGRIADTNGDGIIDPRDSALSGTYNGIPVRDAPARVLDTNGDGVLDDTDTPVPAGAAIGRNPSGAAPIWNNVPGGNQPALGPSAHFNLTAAFEPAERCRELVVWSADWQGYEDFETAPSAPMDSSRYPAVAPYPTMQAVGVWWNSAWVQRTPAQRQAEAFWRTGIMLSEAIRPPELVSLFREPSTLPSGTSRVRRGDQVMTVSDINNFGGYAPTTLADAMAAEDESNPMSGESPDIIHILPGGNAPLFLDAEKPTLGASRMILLGRYGANRDGVVVGTLSGVGPNRDGVPNDASRYYATGMANGGPIKRSVSLRAVTVARFNYYDGRVSGALRN